MYQHTRTWTGTISPLDYSALAQGIEVSEEHSALRNHKPRTLLEREAFAYMTRTPEEMAIRFEQQAQVQREQLNMIRAQHESMDTLKQMLSQLLKGKKKPNAKTPSKKSEGKRKEGESSFSARMKNVPTLSHPSLHLKRGITQRMEALIQKG